MPFHEHKVAQAYADRDRALDQLAAKRGISCVDLAIGTEDFFTFRENQFSFE